MCGHVRICACPRVLCERPFRCATDMENVQTNDGLTEFFVLEVGQARQSDRRWSATRNRIAAEVVTRDLALDSMARDDAPASSTASSTAAVLQAVRRPPAAAMRSKVGSEFET